MKGEQLCKKIDEYYQEMVTWRRNLFKVPSGKQGQAFVSKLAQLFRSFGDAPSMEVIALKAAMVLLSVKAKYHISCIQ